MPFFSKNFKTINCINGCILFEDRNNYAYWENNKVTSDEEEIVNYLNKFNLTENKNLLHIGIGNSYIALSLKKFKNLDGITISNNELIKGNEQKIPNYKVHFKNKYSKNDLIENRFDYYDIIIDNNLKSFACCNKAFDDLINKYKNYLKNNGFIITSLKGMNWSRIVKPVYSFSFKKFFYKRLKEFDGPSTNLMDINDCKKLCDRFNFKMNLISNHLILLKKV